MSISFLASPPNIRLPQGHSGYKGLWCWKRRSLAREKSVIFR